MMNNNHDPKTQQGEFPPTPHSSSCLTLQRIIQSLRKIWRKVSHRKATTGLTDLHSVTRPKYRVRATRGNLHLKVLPRKEYRDLINL